MIYEFSILVSNLLKNSIIPTTSVNYCFVVFDIFEAES
jgi:hypothetical protein